MAAAAAQRGESKLAWRQWWRRRGVDSQRSGSQRSWPSKSQQWRRMAAAICNAKAKALAAKR
jgi:hypothetical protein